MKNNEVTFLSDDLKSDGENGFKEGGAKVRKTIEENVEIFQGYWEFWTKAKKVGMEKGIFKKQFEAVSTTILWLQYGISKPDVYGLWLNV